jgi:uncharacterized protein (DUF1330 family)
MGDFMPAYVIAEIETTDPAKMEEYRKRAPASVAAFQGKYIARGGTTAVLEGSWTPSRIVILEFPSLDQAKRWYASPEYAHAKEARKGGGTMRVIAVEGT